MTSFFLRLLIGAVFALFGLVNYFGSSTVNPVTGESQRVQISAQQEIALGQQSAPEMAKQHGGELPVPELQAYVQAVGDRVWKNSDAAKGPYPMQFHLLSDTKTVNAFALPGGQVFITAAMLARLDTEAQLAGVLGHEVGHVIGRHGAEHMAKQKLSGALVNAVGVATSDGYGNSGAAVIADAVRQFSSLKYGRADETESDVLGFRFMVQAGYDPTGIEDVMKILASLRGGKSQPEMLSSHPDPGDRAAKLQQMIADAFPQGIPSELEAGRDRFAKIVGPYLRRR
jgi:beta-barrel assembly-enhancing protease